MCGFCEKENRTPKIGLDMMTGVCNILNCNIDIFLHACSIQLRLHIYLLRINKFILCLMNATEYCVWLGLFQPNYLRAISNCQCVSDNVSVCQPVSVCQTYSISVSVSQCEPVSVQCVLVSAIVSLCQSVQRVSQCEQVSAIVYLCQCILSARVSVSASVSAVCHPVSASVSAVCQPVTVCVSVSASVSLCQCVRL